jgi:predicted dehydrogenase
MPEDKLNIALVGAAGLVAAPAHLNSIPTIERLNFVAVCDVDADAILLLARERGIEKAYSSYEELLADPDIDAVDLTTPPFVHAEMAIAAARAGKHVYVEKPMARSLGEAPGCSTRPRTLDLEGRGITSHGATIRRFPVDDGSWSALFCYRSAI